MILVIGDPHIASYHKFSQVVDSGYTIRELEHLQVAKDIVNAINNNEVECVVCLGDVFDKVGDKISIDNMRTVAEWISIIQEACIKKNILFYILVGNHDSNSANGYSHKLIPFKPYQNIRIIDSFEEENNMIFLPHSIDVEYAESFLQNKQNKKDKIVFSHMELKDINLGNGIFTTKGISLHTLSEFKDTLQGHYHTPGKYGKNIWLPGATQKTSFKDPGGGYLCLYEDQKVIKQNYTGPKWYTLYDEDLDQLSTISNDNYVKLCLSCDSMLDINGIKKEDLNRFKGSEIEIDIHRISSKNLKRSQEEIEVESPTEILNTFINQQNIDEEKKKKLIDKGQELLQRV